ncbi:MAG: DNA-directed RNA polymerase subunit L [Methanomicrobiales archaeon]|nr:DNA-directed RNA polymerase subunit L [Methanomicrobiales archaeon]
MNIEILELTGVRARILFRGESHTFMNMLTDEILQDPVVDVAKYTMEFQFSDPELVVTTDGKKDPLTVVREACQRLMSDCDELLKDVRAAVPR